MNHSQINESRIKRKALFWTIVIHLFLISLFFADSPTKMIDFVKAKLEKQEVEDLQNVNQENTVDNAKDIKV